MDDTEQSGHGTVSSTSIAFDPGKFIVVRPRIKTAGRFVAVEPFQDTSVKKVRTEAGFVKVEQKQKLTGLKVVFDSAIALAESVVYLPADKYVMEWARKVYTIEDKTFILVPEGEVLLVEGY